MKAYVLNGMLWTVACAVLFYWLFSYAALSLINAQHNPTITHYKNAVCPVPRVP